MLNLLSAVAFQCVIVIPTDQPPNHAAPAIVRRHEMARCKGYTGIAIAPKRYDAMPWPQGLELVVVDLPTAAAEQACRKAGGISYGCSWFNRR